MPQAQIDHLTGVIAGLTSDNPAFQKAQDEIRRLRKQIVDDAAALRGAVGKDKADVQSFVDRLATTIKPGAEPAPKPEDVAKAGEPIASQKVELPPAKPAA